MKEITKENLKESYEPLADIFLKWAQINTDIIKFQNYANILTFEKVFGVTDAGRLHRHFKLDCDGKYDKFRTYLTQEQVNLLLMNLHINRDYIY